MRHDRVHEAFTMLLQKDKAFTRENFSAFFAKKEAFSKLWGDYRKLLGR
jgi:phosphopantetheinyl transferase (holo-ACP synthase)